MFRNGIQLSFRRGFISAPKTNSYARNLFASRLSFTKSPLLLSSSLLLLAGGVSCTPFFTTSHGAPIYNESPTKPYPLSPEISPADASLDNFNSETQRERRKKVYRQITTGSLFGLLAGTVFGKLSRVIFVFFGSGMVLFEWLLTRGVVQRITGGTSKSASGSSRVLGLFGLNGLSEELQDLSGTSGNGATGRGVGERVGQWVRSSWAYMKVFPAFKLSFFVTFALAAYNI